jgi:HPr kinase/phosphorylase
MSLGVTVGTLVGLRDDAGGLNLDVLAGAAGLDRRITIPFIQKTGLALAGFDEFLRPGRVLVFGESEVRFLERMDAPARAETLARLFSRDLPCVLITLGLDPPADLVSGAEDAGIPVLRSDLSTPVAMARLTALLDDRLAPREMRHGVLIDVLGLGVLVTGESGIGKSECALDLVVRGHRLVADDTVEVRCRSGSILIGRCPEFTRHHMEIRGLGIVNVTDLFGVAATRAQKRVELVVRLERWEAGREYDRLGLESTSLTILGVSVPLVTIPVATARNLAMLVEVAARNHLLRTRGRDAARLLASRLERRLEELADRAMDVDSEEL